MRIRSVFFSFGLILFCWVFFFLFRLSYEVQTPKNWSYLPENVNLAVAIDGRGFLKGALTSVLVEAKDENVVSGLRKFITREPKDGKGKSRNYGINFVSDALYFRSTDNGKKYSGLLVNLKNTENFDRNLADVNSNKNMFVRRHEQTGIILLSNELSRAELKGVSTKLIAGSAGKKAKSFTAESLDKQLIHLYADKKALRFMDVYHSAELNFETEENYLHFTGSLKLNDAEKFIKGSKRLKPKDFHVFTAHIPKIVRDSIRSYAHQAEIELPPLKSFSLNYGGLKLFLNKSSLIFLPKMELLLEFEDSLNASKIVDNSRFLEKFGIVKENGRYRIGEETCYVFQAANNLVYLGTNPNPEFIASDETQLIIEGDLTRLTDIDADWLISAAIQANSSYQALNGFFQASDHISLRVQKKRGNTADLKGEIVFKDGHFALNEIINLLLTSQISL